MLEIFKIKKILQFLLQVVADRIPVLVQSIKGTMNDPENTNAHITLINRAQEMIAPCTKLVGSAKSACPTIEDEAAAMSLNSSAKCLAEALVELRTATGKAQEACGSTELDGVLDEMRQLQQELDDLLTSLDQGRLVPLPGETVSLQIPKIFIFYKFF